MPFQKGHGRFRTDESYKKAGLKIAKNPNSQKTQFKKGSSGFTGKHTEETKKKIREARARQGSNVWNKGLKGYKVKPCSEERKKKISNAQIGEKNHNWRGGKPYCIDCRKKLSQHHQKGKRCRKCFGISKRNKNHWNWLGGLSRKPYPIYWRETLKREVKERDKYICKICFSKEKLSVHHIDYNKDNCGLDNLITLCKSCNTKCNKNRSYWINYFKKYGK